MSIATHDTQGRVGVILGRPGLRMLAVWALPLLQRLCCVCGTAYARTFQRSTPDRLRQIECSLFLGGLFHGGDVAMPSSFTA
jgi:hypothetical protein